MILLSSHSRSVKSVAGNDDSPGGAGKVKFLWSSFANCRSFCLDYILKVYMKKKKEEMLIAKNVFKLSDFKTQKKSFNERFEKYINFCENKL